ncbi:MAG: di-heme enzyme [Gemmatimonadaceae bacterium]
MRWLPLLVLAVACADGNAVGPVIPSGNPAKFHWTLPTGFPTPVVPDANPMSDAKVELGRRLFYDTRLSGIQNFSCSSCHRQENAFADARNVPFGSTGEAHPRNSIGLTNVAYQPAFGWADPDTRQLEEQAPIPMFNVTPVELGLKGRESEVLQRLRDVTLYRQLFAAAFPGLTDAISIQNVANALASFQRTFLSGDSPYDRYVRGDTRAISASAIRGEGLFRSARLACSQCHGGVLFTNFATYVGGPASAPEYINNGLYNLGGTGAYPVPNTGLTSHTGVASDMGKFKVPTLRNIALTFPYMHDGSLGSLSEVIDHYAAGGRTIASGANAGVGRLNPFKSPLVAGFTITGEEKADLIAFLESLTDSAFVTRATLSNPWIVR